MSSEINKIMKMVIAVTIIGIMLFAMYTVFGGEEVLSELLSR